MPNALCKASSLVSEAAALFFCHLDICNLWNDLREKKILSTYLFRVPVFRIAIPFCYLWERNSRELIKKSSRFQILFSFHSNSPAFTLFLVRHSIFSRISDHLKPNFRVAGFQQYTLIPAGTPWLSSLFDLSFPCIVSFWTYGFTKHILLMLCAKKFRLVPTGLAYIKCYNRTSTLEASWIWQKSTPGWPRNRTKVLILSQTPLYEHAKTTEKAKKHWVEDWL